LIKEEEKKKKHNSARKKKKKKKKHTWVARTHTKSIFSPAMWSASSPALLPLAAAATRK